MKEILIVSAIGFMIWYFLLRKRFRSLGLRMFMVFSLVAFLMSFWFYQDSVQLLSMESNGQLISAKVLDKWIKRTGENSIVYCLFVEVPLPNRNISQVTTSDFISSDEYNAIQVGNIISVLYNTTNQQIIYSVSLERYKKDKWIFWILPLFFLSLGILLWYLLHNIDVGIHEDTGDEYLEKNGKIWLDEKGNGLAKTAKKANIVSKIIQMFNK